MAWIHSSANGIYFQVGGNLACAGVNLPLAAGHFYKRLSAYSWLWMGNNANNHAPRRRHRLASGSVV